MLKRLAAILMALAMTLTLTSPLYAWSSGGGSYEWRYDNGNTATTPVCAAENFDKPVGDGWDYSILTHDAVRYAVSEFNAYGLTLHYTMTNQRCADVTGDHLEIRWVGGSGAPDNPQGLPSISYWTPTETVGFCTSHCQKVGQIVMDDDAALQSLGGSYSDDTWYVKSNNTIPGDKIAFREVVLHELGHASGLRHSEVRDSIMCSEESAGVGCAHTSEIRGPATADYTYDLDDIAGFCGPPWNDAAGGGNFCD